MGCGGGQVGRLLPEGLCHRKQASAAAESGNISQKHKGDVGHVSRDVEEDGKAGGFCLTEVVQPGSCLLSS